MRRRLRVTAIAGAVFLAGSLSGCGQPPWQNQLVSVNAAGTDSAAGETSLGPVGFSPDGTKAVFASPAGNLGPTDTNGTLDVYIRYLTSGTTSLVSVNAAGTEPGNRASFHPRLSADGTKVAFISQATDLGPVVSGHGIYVRDLVAGTTTLVTVNGAGTDTSAGGLWDFQVSADGTKVLWSTQGDDLGPLDHSRGEQASDNDVYLRDLAAGTTALVSVNAAGTDSADAPTDFAQFSADGTKVRFNSHASDLVPDDTNGAFDAFERDLETGVTRRIVLGVTTSMPPIHSADETKVAFSTTANDLGPIDSDCTSGPGWPAEPCSDVYVRDLTTGVTTLVSHNASGIDSGSGRSILLGLSDDGTKVVFSSWASNLGSADPGQDYDIYTHDLATGVTSLVTVNAAGTDGLPSGSPDDYVVVSADGTRVGFETEAANLGATDNNGTSDVYVRDVAAGTTALVSHRASGPDAGNGASIPWAFSPDGTKLLFRSRASNLVPTDTNGTFDLFVATLPTP